MSENKYLYTIITRENAAECDLDPNVWVKHPEWNYFIRTNIKCRYHGGGRLWVSGGGATLEEAIKCAEYHLNACVFSPHPLFPGHYQPLEEKKLTGEVADFIIKD